MSFFHTKTMLFLSQKIISFHTRAVDPWLEYCGFGEWKKSVVSNEARSNNVVQSVGESQGVWGFESDCVFLLVTGIKYKYPRLPSTL